MVRQYFEGRKRISINFINKTRTLAGTQLASSDKPFSELETPLQHSKKYSQVRLNQIRIRMQEWESYSRVQDRFKLFAFGMRKRKDLLTKKMHGLVMNCVRTIKTRFRKVLRKYQDWKSDIEIKRLQTLINEFYKGIEYKKWMKKQKIFVNYLN